MVIGGSNVPGCLRSPFSPEDVPGGVDDKHVVHAVACQIRHEGGGLRSGDKRPGGNERPAHVQEHRDVVGAVIGNGQSGAAIAIKVACHQRGGLGLHAIGQRGAEGAVTVARQHRHGVGVRIGARKVGATVAVEVARHQRNSAHDSRQCRRSLKRAVAVTEQHRSRVRLGRVGDGEVGATVGVEVARYQGAGW